MKSLQESMNSTARTDKFKCAAAAAAVTLLFVCFISVKWDFYWDLNDDFMIDRLLTGAYTGEPAARDIQNMFPFSLRTDPVPLPVRRAVSCSVQTPLQEDADRRGPCGFSCGRHDVAASGIHPVFGDRRDTRRCRGVLVSYDGIFGRSARIPSRRAAGHRSDAAGIPDPVGDDAVHDASVRPCDSFQNDGSCPLRTELRRG